MKEALATGAVVATQEELLTELDALYKRYREVQHIAIWGGSYEREQGARMELKPIVNDLFDKLLKLLEQRKPSEPSLDSPSGRALPL